MTDDVLLDVKKERLNRMCAVYRAEAEKVNLQQIGVHQLILVEGTSKRSAAHLAGRNDYNTKVIFPRCDIPEHDDSEAQRPIKPGDYIVVQVNDANSQVLKGIPLYHITMKDFNNGPNYRRTWSQAM